MEFLGSRWPWRALGYLASSALLCGIVVLVAVGIGSLEHVGLRVAAGLAVFGLAVPFVGLFERWRLTWVDTTASRTVTHNTSAPTPTHPASTEAHSRPDRPSRGRSALEWRVAGAGLASLLVLSWIDVIMFGLTVGGPVLLVLTPVVQPPEAIAPGPAVVVAVGSLLLVPAAVYTFTAWAGARGAMLRGLLGGRDAELDEVLRSRARLVDAFEVERRRIERDLHDGAQQRLVALSMRLGLAKLDLPDESPAKEQLALAHEEAKHALNELRELIRGVHTPVLIDRGLPAAVREAAGLSAIPVDVDVVIEQRPATAVEVAAYYAVSESLANIAKHSGAHRASIRARIHAETLTLEIEDDGKGGADPAHGTGLIGLSDRLAVVDGTIAVSSPLGGPTVVRVDIPVT
ncbi:histidine kinase [Planobispora takensis]|uniref:histidine kinase n=1 Tax=Planobispora takensis TaxID=1367882 RepID=A0A8J3SVW4_9ACTN|nr:histidine kinase [Planobispora takensis]